MSHQDATNLLIENDYYKVTFYPAASNVLIISFLSVGGWGAGEPVEEFKGTLSKFGVAMAFVEDKPRTW